MFAFLQGPEFIVVAVVVLVLFGGTQLPKFAKNLGQAQKEFKKVLPMASPTSPAIPTLSNAFSRCLCGAALRLQAAAGTFTHAAPHPVFNLFR